MVRFRFRGCAGLAAALFLWAPAAAADCLRDSKGEVYCGGGRCLADREGKIWCARARDGDAKATRSGVVLCGSGRCERSRHGEIFCSSEEGGAVLTDSFGRVRCQGKCEPATVEACENTRADSSG